MRLTSRGRATAYALLVVAGALLGANLAPADWTAPQILSTVTR